MLFYDVFYWEGVAVLQSSHRLFFRRGCDELSFCWFLGACTPYLVVPVEPENLVSSSLAATKFVLNWAWNRRHKMLKHSSYTETELWINETKMTYGKCCFHSLGAACLWTHVFTRVRWYRLLKAKSLFSIDCLNSKKMISELSEDACIRLWEARNCRDPVELWSRCLPLQCWNDASFLQHLVSLWTMDTTNKQEKIIKRVCACVWGRLRWGMQTHLHS